MATTSNWMPKTRELELLDSLGKHRNLGRAADAIKMQQPVASRTVKDMEARLSVKLFLRTPYGMTPTPVGEYLIAQAQATIGSLKSVALDVENFVSGKRGIIKIGIAPSIPPDFVVQTISELSTLTDSLSYSLLQANHSHLVDSIEKRELDVIFTRSTLQVQEALLKTRLLFMDEFVFVSSYPETEDTAGFFARSCWILPAEGLPLRAAIDARMLKQFGFRPANVIEATAMDIVRALLETTPCIAVAPKRLVNSWGDVPRFRVFRLGQQEYGSPVFLITPHQSVRPSTNLFITTLQQRIGSQA